VKYDPDNHPKLAEEACKAGATGEELAKALGVSRRTVYAWMETHVEFFQAVMAGRKIVEDIVENKMFVRAKGMIFTEIKIVTSQTTVMGVGGDGVKELRRR